MLAYINEVIVLAKSKVDPWLEEDKLLLLAAWARDGLTDVQISHNMGVSPRTLATYKEKRPQILQALKRGKEVADIEVENALNKKALGFKETILKPMKLKTVHYNNGKREKEEESVQMVEEEIYIPPDVTAQIFWLKNRKPEQWRDKREVDASLSKMAEIGDNVNSLAEVLKRAMPNRKLPVDDGGGDEE